MIQKYYYNNFDYIAYSQIKQTSSKKPHLLFFTGLKSDMQGTKVLAIEEFAKNYNYNFTRFDYYGHGQSSGNFSDGNLTIWLDNCLHVIDNISNQPVIIIGSSIGGWLMLLAALKKPKLVKGLIGIAIAPDFTQNLILDKLTTKELAEFEKNNLITINDHITLTYDMVRDSKKYFLLENNIALNIPIILHHGMKDESVPYEISLQTMDRLTSNNVKLNLVKDADHRFSTPENISDLTNSIISLTKFIHYPHNDDK